MGASQSDDAGTVNSTTYVRVVKPSLAESLGLSKSSGGKKEDKSEEKPSRRSSFLDCCVSRSKEDGTEPVDFGSVGESTPQFGSKGPGGDTESTSSI